MQVIGFVRSSSLDRCATAFLEDVLDVAQFLRATKSFCDRFAEIKKQSRLLAC